MGGAAYVDDSVYVMGCYSGSEALEADCGTDSVCSGGAYDYGGCVEYSSGYGVDASVGSSVGLGV